MQVVMPAQTQQQGAFSLPITDLLYDGLRLLLVSIRQIIAPHFT